MRMSPRTQPGAWIKTATTSNGTSTARTKKTTIKATLRNLLPCLRGERQVWNIGVLNYGDVWAAVEDVIKHESKENEVKKKK